MVSMVYGAQLVVLQQFGQLPRIDAIILIAFFQQSISPRIANDQFADVGFNRSYNQADQVPSSKVTCTSPRSPSRNCRIMLALVWMTLSITILPAEFRTAIEMLSLCTSIPIYLRLLVIKGCAPFRMVCATTKPYTKRGHPFIMRLTP